jgi:hypothetical protein
MHQALHPQLARLTDQLDEVSELSQKLVEGLLPDQLRLRPEPDRWSIAECFAHLSLCSEVFVALVNSACREAREKQQLGTGPFKMDKMARFLNWTMKPPARIKVRTTAKFEPVEISVPEDVLPRFLVLQRELRQEIEKSEGLDLNKVVVTSPFSKRLKYNLFSCFVLIVTHELRHLWQAEQVKRELLREG